MRHFYNTVLLSLKESDATLLQSLSALSMCLEVAASELFEESLYWQYSDLLVLRAGYSGGYLIFHPTF